MEKQVTNTTKLRRIIREVMGDDWLKYKQVFPDKRKAGYRVKVIPARMTDQQIAEVVLAMKNQHGLTVHAAAGCSGGRMLPWVAFHVPYDD